MEASPLTQQDRPQVFRPKVDLLYEQVLQDSDEDEKPEGFWTELFLLKPDVGRFEQTIGKLDARYLLRIQHRSQQFVVNAIAAAKAGSAPADEHALHTLALFLNQILAKRFVSPSADLIQVLAGLDNVDAVFTDLVDTVLQAITQDQRPPLCRYALKVAIALSAGAFQTSLVTYFAQRDLFTPLTRLLQRVEEPTDASLALVLLGVLTNYNKFEMHNPYQTRHVDYSSRMGMIRISQSVGSNCSLLQEQYVAIQDDLPESWSVGSALGYIGLGSLTGSKAKAPVLTAQEIKEQFAAQPQRGAAILLSLYDFALTNRDFRHEFTSLPPAADSRDTPDATSGIEGFLSLFSYLVQHGHRSTRAGLYAHLALLTTQILLEDPLASKQLCTIIPVNPIRQCRHRPPFLPSPPPSRPLAASILDTAIDCLTHNLRPKLDVALYTSALDTITRVLHTLSTHRIRWTEQQYAWSQLWRALLSLVRFCGSYADRLRPLAGVEELVLAVPRLLARCLARGETFLGSSSSSSAAAAAAAGTPGSAVPGRKGSAGGGGGVDAMDDLCYKVAESGTSLQAFRDAWFKRPPQPQPQPPPRLDARNVDLLIAVSSHFRDRVGARLSPEQVMSAIRASYDSLSLADGGAGQILAGAEGGAVAAAGSGYADAVGRGDAGPETSARFAFRAFHEQDYRSLVRRIVRVVVEDAAGLVSAT